MTKTILTVFFLKHGVQQNYWIFCVTTSSVLTFTCSRKVRNQRRAIFAS